MREIFIGRFVKWLEEIIPSHYLCVTLNNDTNGNLFGVGYANGVQHDYAYNALNRLTNLSVVRFDGQTSNATTLQSYSYNLDKNGMRTKITELSGRTINHVYDKLLRLTQENITGGYAGDPNGTLSYTYDAVSNRTSRNATETLAALLPNQTHSFTVNDRLTSDTYDANGNTTSSLVTDHPALGTSSATDVYSFNNRLIRRTRADGKVINITYNPDGHRIYKQITQGGLTVKLQHYLTDTNNPTGYAQVIEEKNPLATVGNELSKVHLYGHDLISSLITDHSALTTSSIFYSYDGLGSVRSITNEQGLINETYDYDAYGNLIGFAKYNATSNALEAQNLTDSAFSYANLGSEYLFTGEQWDADLGMVFLRARYMNTGTGRFHSMDTYEGRNGEPLTLHKYLYAHANPAMFVDPSGYSSNSLMTETGIVVSYLARFAVINFPRTIGVLKGLSVGLTAIAFAVDPAGFYNEFADSVRALGPIAGSGAALYRISAQRLSGLKRLLPFFNRNLAGNSRGKQLLLTGSSQGQINAVRGNVFHRSVYDSLRLPENTAKVSGNVRGRIINTEPDMLGLRTGVTDIKDELRINFDKQLRAQYDHAVQTNQSFNLVISSRTQTISEPLQQAIRQRNGIIVEFDAVSGSFRNVKIIGNRVLR